MHIHDEMKRIIDDWLIDKGCESEWERLINPPGERLYVRPSGPTVFITDFATENNSLPEILDALKRQLEDKLGVEGDWSLKSNLTLAVR